DHPVRHRADQQLLDMAPELGAEEAGGDVAVAVLDHAHHHQAGDDEVHVADPVHLADARADQPAEDQEVQGHGDRRRDQGLGPDPQDPADLAPGDGAQRDPVAAGDAAPRGHFAGAHAAALPPRAGPVSPSPWPVRRTNSSSSRLVRLRIERTRIPASLSRSKMPLRSIARGIASTSVLLSRAESVVPAISGSGAGSSPSMSSTKPSTSSLASSARIGPCSTIVPWSMIA